MQISLVEYGVARHPKGLEGWRMFRIEYGGHAEACLAEGTIWLPPSANVAYIEGLLEGLSVGWIEYDDKGMPQAGPVPE